MQLRAARDLDAGAVGAILSGFIDETDWMPRLHTRAEDVAHAAALIARGWVTVAEEAGKVLGFAANDGDELDALYVGAAAQGRGVGTALLGHVRAGRGQLTLWTFQANTRAQQFYLKHGFAEIARTNGARNDEKLPDIQYRWQREPV